MPTAQIKVPKKALVYIVEDSPERIAWFREKLGDRIVRIDHDPKEAIRFLRNVGLSHFIKIVHCVDNIDLFFLDHDLGGPYQPPYSTDIARCMYIEDQKIGKRTVIHSCNFVGAANLARILPGSLLMPFGSFDIVDAA